MSGLASLPGAERVRGGREDRGVWMDLSMDKQCVFEGMKGLTFSITSSVSSFKKISQKERK